MTETLTTGVKADDAAWDAEAIMGVAFLLTLVPAVILAGLTIAVDLATGTPFVDHAPAAAAMPFVWWAGLFMFCFLALLLVSWVLERMGVLKHA